MATLPYATITLDDAAGASGAGSQLIAICAPTPGVSAVTVTEFASTTALLEEYDFCQGAAYAALHFDETRLPVVYCAMPIATAGVITHLDRSGVTGTSRLTVTAGADGSLEAVDATATVVDGGTVGTDNITIDLTLDGDQSTKRVRIGTATSYTIPYVGHVLALGAGTLVAGDVLAWKSTAPTFDASGATAVRVALAAENIDVRTLFFVGDVATEAIADAVRAAAETYATSDDRFVRARIQARDQYRAAEFVGFRGKTVGASLTFAEVGATGDTITRATGSFVDDGFTVGDTIVITGAVASAGANNITAVIAGLTATVITLGSEDLIAEGPITSATIKAYSTLTYAEVGATADTITRNSGSFVTDGFKAGMKVTSDGTASNDFASATVTTVTATVLTLDTQDLVAETIGAQLATLDGVESKADWRADITDEFEDISGDEARRITISAGYAAKLCPITGWRFRRGAQWAASLREYKHAEHIPTWRVADGALGGFTLEDADGRLVEHDERVDGGLLSAGFTCLRTWNNKTGCFVALDLTRADEGSLLSRSHAMDVANVMCTTVQRATQNLVGTVLEIGSNGRATEASLQLFEGAVNAEVDVAMRQDVRGEGPRASAGTKYEASRADVLNTVDAILNGTAQLRLNKAVEKIATRIAVPQGG
jgi:hypothetical protein